MKTEDRMLADFHEWAWNNFPHLRGLCFHPLNEQIGGAFQGALNKAKGVVAGVSDYVCLVVGTRGEPFLCLEFKTETGTQSPKQKDFEAKVLSQGGVYWVVRSTEDAQVRFKAHTGL